MKLTTAFGAGVIFGAAGLAGGLVIAAPDTDAVKAHPEGTPGGHTRSITPCASTTSECGFSSIDSSPAKSSPCMHSHPHGFVYMLADARAHVTRGDGSSSVDEDHAGDLTWRGPTTHAYENVRNTDVHAIGVELKPCASR